MDFIIIDVVVVRLYVGIEIQLCCNAYYDA